MQSLTAWKRLLTELDNDLSEIIRMSCPNKESDIANLAFVFWFAPELVFLYVRYTFHEEADSKQYHSSNISSSAKIRLMIFRHIWRVQDSHR